MGLNLTIKNIDKIKEEIKSYPQDIERIINNEFQAFGDKTVELAKMNSPINEGALRGSISSTVSNLEVKAGAYIEYAAYLEFGTKGFAAEYVATLPEDWQTFASEYKGTGGGTFKEMLVAIMKWVQLKGIAVTLTKSGNASKSKAAKETQEQAAYAIARSILIKGIRAQPYLFPAYEVAAAELIEHLKEQLPTKK